jgi:hypothetical protein
MPRARELLILLIVGTITAHRLLAGDPAAGAANLAARPGFVDASQFGFSPAASGVENMRALQQALDQTGTITISRPGTYKLAGTVFIGSHTALVCGANVALMKVDEQGPFSHVLLNKGALTKTYDEHIAVTGLNVARPDRVFLRQEPAHRQFSLRGHRQGPVRDPRLHL